MAIKCFLLWVAADPLIRDFPETRTPAGTSLSAEISLVRRKVKSQHLFLSVLMYAYKNSYSSRGSKETADYLMQIAGVTRVNLAETQPSSLQAR